MNDDIEIQRNVALLYLLGSAYPHEKQEEIERWILEQTHKSVLSRAIDKLKANQLDPITERGNYRDKDINKHINKLK